MTKQRRSFFVDDILHMVMPINKNTPNENDDLKRKRSISSEDGNKNEEDEILKKKFRSQNHGRNNGDEEAENDNDESNYSHVVDIIGDGGTGDDDSCISDNSNNTDNNSGKFSILKER
jgi:hypothetical protein